MSLSTQSSNVFSAMNLEMLESCVTFEAPFQELQDYSLLAAETNTSMLGQDFDGAKNIETIKDYVISRLWFTYRRNFSPIGGTGPETDQGWGCMLRCAQMLLGEVLLRRHIGTHTSWDRSVPSGDYERILRMFLDEKTALYSIHQIAQMGVSEGKRVGEWFGPNTAAQVLKKLTVFDTWSNLAVHVALDNILIRDDVMTMATLRPPEDAVKLIMEDLFDESLLPPLESLVCPKDESGSSEENSIIGDEPSLLSRPSPWRPLLLIIPLRLGLTTINRVYLPAVQEYFKLPQCVGIIGGRPNHALYFIGITGEKLIYLDPHFCQPSITPYAQRKPDSFCDGFETVVHEVAQEAVEKDIDDSSYHCPMLLSMPYDQVDPSLALSFFCKTKEDFEELSRALKEQLLPCSSPPLFEQLQSRPKYWPPFEPYLGVKTKIEMKEFHDMGAPNYDSDDQFELLE